MQLLSQKQSLSVSGICCSHEMPLASKTGSHPKQSRSPPLQQESLSSHDNFELKPGLCSGRKQVSGI